MTTQNIFGKLDLHGFLFFPGMNSSISRRNALVLIPFMISSPGAYYQQRTKELKTALNGLLKRKSMLGWLRLGCMVVIVAAIYILLPFGIFVVAITSLVLLFIFSRLLSADLLNSRRIDEHGRLLEVCKEEQQYLSHDYVKFPGGERFLDPQHLYANDLDIFGRASLFQYVNRSVGEQGQQQLAAMFSAPAKVKIIRERQQSLQELAQQSDWLLQLKAIGKKTTVGSSVVNRLVKWSNTPPVFLQFTPWKYLRFLLPAIMIIVTVLFVMDLVGNPIFYSVLLAFGVLEYRLSGAVLPIHDQLGKMTNEMDVVYASLLHIENADFKTPLLLSLQARLKGQQAASGNIRRLKKILDRLDLRYNLVLAIPLNIFLLWNLQQVLDLERWKAEHKKLISEWLQTLAEMEALGSLGTLLFNHPAWVFPDVTENYFECVGEAIGHPLIPAAKRVNNDISLNRQNDILLVTGSNMAGKSTYLRSIGVNIVLALAGAPVCASRFKVSHLQLASSMRITDNLEESTSTFYAELKKLKTIIDIVNEKKQVFILLDEILRGTNSGDRHAGSVALVKQLLHHKAPAIIATHDLQLASLAGEFPENIQNAHFDVQVKDEELFFDYRLKPGVCTSMNASLLMKKIGIEL